MEVTADTFEIGRKRRVVKNDSLHVVTLARGIHTMLDLALDRNLVASSKPGPTHEAIIVRRNRVDC